VWAQLVTFRLKSERTDDLAEAARMIEAAELPGSGLIRETFARDTKDPQICCGFVVFESEKQARARESDPRRAAVSADIRDFLSNALEGPPTFVDLDVIHEITVAPGG